MKIGYVKIGTQPFGAALGKYLRIMPKVGGKIYIRHDNGDTNTHSNPWILVVVDRVNDNCVFVSGI